MEFLYCEGMSNAQPSIESYKIKESTVIKKGDVVSLNSSGYIVKAENYTAVIGIAAESHPSEDVLMQKRDSIRVINSSDAVYRAYGIKMRFGSGSTATRLYPTSCDTTNGAYDDTVLVLVSKSEQSENTDSVGTVRTVSSSYLESSESYVFNVSGGGIPHPDDLYAILPCIGATNVFEANDDDFRFNSEYEGTFRCVGHDLSLDNVKGLPSCYLKLNRHVANKKSSY